MVHSVVWRLLVPLLFGRSWLLWLGGRGRRRSQRPVIVGIVCNKVRFVMKGKKVIFLSADAKTKKHLLLDVFWIRINYVITRP